MPLYSTTTAAQIISAGGVIGPASATDNAITRYDTTTGKLVQDSSAFVTDVGSVISGTAAEGTRSTAPSFSSTRTYTSNSVAAHGYADEASVTTTNAALGYCSFDAIPLVGTGTQTLEHVVGYQSRPSVNLAGVTNVFGFWSKPVLTAGAASAVLQHFSAQPYTGGSLDTEMAFAYGASSTATFKYSLYVNGATARLVHEGPGVFGSNSYNGVDASAILTLTSTTKGLLLPRMTTTQKNAISSPAEGLLIYDVTLHKMCIRAAAAWETVTSI